MKKTFQTKKLKEKEEKPRAEKKKMSNSERKQLEDFYDQHYLIQPFEFTRYIMKNIVEGTDELTVEFINKINQKIRRSILIDKEEYFLLEKKAKEIFLNENIRKYYRDICR